MIEKIFGLLFIGAAVLFLIKFTELSSDKNGAHSKKDHSIASVGSPSRMDSSLEPDGQRVNMVEEIRKLLADQDDLVGLPTNIQKISLKSQLKSKKLNGSISKSLAQVANLNVNAPYRIEADVFDTFDPANDRPKRRKKGEDSLPDRIVFQFSVFDVKSGNKVGEFGATFNLVSVAPELIQNQGF